MRRVLIIGFVLVFAGACVLFAAQDSRQAQPQNPPSLPPQQTIPPPAQTPPSQAGQPGQPSSAPQTPPVPVQPVHTLRVVVLDPAHGGADTGARGPSGEAEKDLVLEFAQVIGDALQAQGFQVVMTRRRDVDPSFDDRATIANAQRDAIFISLHIGSTGPPGTVRTYTYLFSPPAVAATAASAATKAGATSQGVNAMATQPVAPPAGFLLWSQAQKPYALQSRKLGDLIQVELGRTFAGSPEISSSVPIYQLRSVAAPAVAVEISSIAMDPQKLEALAPALADEITRAVVAYKTIYPPGGR